MGGGGIQLRNFINSVAIDTAIKEATLWRCLGGCRHSGLIEDFIKSFFIVNIYIFRIPANTNNGLEAFSVLCCLY